MLRWLVNYELHELVLVRCIEAVLERKHPAEFFSVPKKSSACPGAPLAHQVREGIGHGHW